jgi:hypothetical protein
MPCKSTVQVAEAPYLWHSRRHVSFQNLDTRDANIRSKSNKSAPVDVVVGHLAAAMVENNTEYPICLNLPMTVFKECKSQTDALL